MSAVQTITGTTNVSVEAVAAFRADLHGSVFQPQDAGYDEARSIYNGMIDKHPALDRTLRRCCRRVHSVNFARDNRLTLAIRGGGHNGPGLAHATMDW